MNGVLPGGAPQASAAEFVAPYVDTVKEDVELILDLAEVGAEDYLIDLGSGDGRFVIGAAKRGAMAQGVELNPQLVKLAADLAQAAGVEEKALFIEGDIFDADISRASVVTLYLFPEANLQLRPKLLAELRPGTRVVSNSFTMGEWEPDARAQGRTSGGALLWYVPADVRGRWRINVDSLQFNVILDQEFQKVRSIGNNKEQTLTISSVNLRGSKLRFSARIGDSAYSFDGQVEGDRMHGIVQVVGQPQKRTRQWKARRLIANENNQN